MRNSRNRCAIRRACSIAGVLCAGLFTPLFAQTTPGDDPRMIAEQEARMLGETFAEGFYTLDPDKVLTVLHPALSKLGVVPNIRNSGESAILRLTPGTLKAFAKSHNADGHINVEKAFTGIKILDVDPGGRISVFRLVADKDWFDYYLSARIGGRWYLINCVFGGISQLESEEPEKDKAAILAAARGYAQGIAFADFKMVKNSIHLDFERRSIQRNDGVEYVRPETLEMLRHNLACAKRSVTPAPMPDVEFLGLSAVTGAVRIDATDRTEWVFLLKLDNVWHPVNSLWISNDDA
jgi:hypothetical protein